MFTFNRQLQMAAISRNTASVAQDFHNAGGEKIIGAQNANNQLTIIEQSKRYDDIYTNKFGKITFSFTFDCCKTNGNRNRKCENVRPIYYKSSSSSSPIVRQRISPPAKQMKYLNRLTNANTDLLNRFNGNIKMEKKLQSNRLVSPKNDFDYYIRQIRLNESIPFDMITATKIYSKLRKLR